MESKFKERDLVKFIAKGKFYHSTRIGSKGKILSISVSPGLILPTVYWVEFKSSTEHVYENQLENWKSPSRKKKTLNLK